jgi:hypothetical protein
MNLTVRTRSANVDLYNKMRSFIPSEIQCVAHTAYDDWRDAARFLHDAIGMTEDFLLVCDEDCFIVDWKAVEILARTMENRGLVFCGVPDGGEILHRCFSWCVANPSFVLFNIKAMRSFFDSVPRDLIDIYRYAPKFEVYQPNFLLGAFNHGDHEPFNGLYYALLSIGTPLYLRGETLGDGLTTAIKGLDGKTIALHSWMSRDKDEKNQARINRVYEYALSLKNG